MADPNPTSGLPGALATHEELLRQHFPSGFTTRAVRTKRGPELIEDWGMLDDTHVQAAAEHVESGDVLGPNFSSNIQRLRHSHHRLAQLLAMGMSATQTARVCNYSLSGLERLKRDPAFQELVAHYKSEKDVEFTEFVTAAKDLSLDMVGRLREVLEEEPERLSPTVLLDAIRTLADRSGNAPVARSVSVSVNANMGDRLRAARERAAIIDSTSTVVEDV